jgi:hypothetical protein
MPGAKIPVLETEKLTLTKDGRGLYVYDDGDILSANTWDAVNIYASGAGAGYTIKVLPAASTTAWLKVIYMSGSSGTETTGYIPVFNSTLL